jgi:N6-L-threonylcarbamoyladenine synthase
MAGVSFAAAFATAIHVPLVRTSHQQGHLAAALLGVGEKALLQGQNLVFHVSGGTTQLLLCEGYEVLQKLGVAWICMQAKQLTDLGYGLDLLFLPVFRFRVWQQNVQKA